MNNQLRQLLARYFNNTIDKSDCEVLLQQLENSDPEQVSALVDELLKTEQPTALLGSDRQERIYDKLAAHIQQHSAATVMPPTLPRRPAYRQWIRIAALWTVAISAALLLYYTYRSTVYPPKHPAAAATSDDILLPDGTQAMLTLANGETLVLHDSMVGMLASQVGIAIRITADGSVWYDTRSMQVTSAQVPFNTFSTPKGHSHQLVLPDGTRVWLNTSSAIRFPVAFTGDERRVVLTGEAYFEVAHNAAKPFKVEATGSTIAVLGTHFNVSAYADDPQVVTTLLEGAVDVSMDGSRVALKPGEQAVSDGATGRIWQSKADIQSAMAWKNGYFRFNDERIESIINKVSRWYDIERVAYEGQFNDRFTGTFQRSKSIAQLFDHLERIAPIQFRIEGKEVVIMK